MNTIKKAVTGFMRTRVPGEALQFVERIMDSEEVIRNPVFLTVEDDGDRYVVATSLSDRDCIYYLDGSDLKVAYMRDDANSVHNPQYYNKVVIASDSVRNEWTEDDYLDELRRYNKTWTRYAYGGRPDLLEPRTLIDTWLARHGYDAYDFTIEDFIGKSDRELREFDFKVTLGGASKISSFIQVSLQYSVAMVEEVTYGDLFDYLKTLNAPARDDELLKSGGEDGIAVGRILPAIDGIRMVTLYGVDRVHSPIYQVSIESEGSSRDSLLHLLGEGLFTQQSVMYDRLARMSGRKKLSVDRMLDAFDRYHQFL